MRIQNADSKLFRQLRLLQHACLDASEVLSRKQTCPEDTPDKAISTPFCSPRCYKSLTAGIKIKAKVWLAGLPWTIVVVQHWTVPGGTDTSESFTSCS